MAIIVSTNAYITVGGTNLSDHATSITVNDGQETRDASVMGTAYRLFRAGLGTPSISVTFKNDHAASSVENTLRSLITTSTSGVVTIEARKLNSNSSSTNPTYSMVGILDGDLNVLNDSIGEIAEISARFVPYSSFTVSTTAT